jgi:hypothetical protein
MVVIVIMSRLSINLILIMTVRLLTLVASGLVWIDIFLCPSFSSSLVYIMRRDILSPTLMCAERARRGRRQLLFLRQMFLFYSFGFSDLIRQNLSHAQATAH